MKEFVLKIILCVAAVLAPAKATLIAAFVFCLADLLTGILAAKKRGEAIESAKMRRSITKLFVWEAVLIMAFLGETYLGLGEIFPVMKWAAALIASTELLSIYENLNVISGQDMLKNLLQKLGSKNEETAQKKD